MTTTTVDTQAIVAGSGGTSTPVKLTLQAGTQSVALQISVTTTRAVTSTLLDGLRREFTLYWAFSPDNLTLANVPMLLRHCAKSQSMCLNPDIEQAGQRQQIKDKVAGQYLYVWFGYPASPHAYAVVVEATEVTTSSFSSGAAGAPSTDIISVQGVAHTFTSAAVQTITLGGTAQSVFAQDLNRAYLFVLNTSDTIMYLEVTGAAATSASIPLAAATAEVGGGYYEPLVAPGSAISILCATTGKTFVAKQA